jgi:NAD(P)-dependent dehydrogenase (short-subunit alcohol dehydrogenase family)
MPARAKPDLKGKVAFVTGGSRGIGRECCLALARCGANVVVVAKSSEPTEALPGSIYTVAEELKALGVDALPIRADVRDADACFGAVEKTVQHFGRIDILINNASALWWHTIDETPLKKYDLITSINTRGSFALAKAAMPHMKKQGYGRVICCSPPIQTNYEGYKGFTAYNISKAGMSMVALGCAAEGADHGVTGNCMWPATVVESQASINFSLGDRKEWRTAEVLTETMLCILSEPSTFTGNTLIDDEYLISRGWTMKEIDAAFACVKGATPSRFLAEHLALHGSDKTKGIALSRGDVRKVTKDIERSKL